MFPECFTGLNGSIQKGVDCRDTTFLRNALQPTLPNDGYDKNSIALISVCNHESEDFVAESKDSTMNGAPPDFWRSSDVYRHTFLVDQTIVQVPHTSNSCTLSRIISLEGTWAEIQYLRGALVVSVIGSSPEESTAFQIAPAIAVGQRFTQKIAISALKSDFYLNESLVLSLDMPDSEFYFQTGVSSHCAAEVDKKNNEASIVWIHDLSTSHTPTSTPNYHNEVTGQGTLGALATAEFIADALTALNSSHTTNFSSSPTPFPTEMPTPSPTVVPTSPPSSQPAAQPTAAPSSQPTGQPTSSSSYCPSSQPSTCPSSQPSAQPSHTKDITNASPNEPRSTYRAAVNPAAIGAILLGGAAFLMIVTVVAIVVIGKRRRRREEIRDRELSAGMLGSIDRAMNLSYSSYHGLMLYENKGSSHHSSRRNSHGGEDSPSPGIFSSGMANHITGFRDSYDSNSNDITNGHAIAAPQQTTAERAIGNNNTVRSPIIDQSMGRNSIV
jgi:hypothetical protein